MQHLKLILSLKTLSSNTVPLGVKTLTCEFSGYTIQSITGQHVDVENASAAKILISSMIEMVIDIADYIDKVDKYFSMNNQ